MLNRLTIATLCIMLASPVLAAEADLGGLKLKLDPPAGYCDLDAAQASDKRMIDFVTASLGGGGIDLLAVSADCGELKDWRSGKAQFLKHFSQYQTAKATRSAPYPVSKAKEECESMRAQGAKMTSDSLGSVNENIRKANREISVEGANFLGVVENDPNGCYAAMFQKYRAENGTIISQLNMFYVSSLKERSVNFFLWTPYEGDMSTTALLTAAKAHVAKLKAANGI